MGLTIGVDVGGTKIAAGVVDEEGKILSRLRRESPATDSDAMQETIAGLIHELAADHDVEAVGVGAAGFVDVSRSTVLFTPNLAWRDEPLKADMERLTGLPVVVENDANAAAWGEFAFGAGGRRGRPAAGHGRDRGRRWHRARRPVAPRHLRYRCRDRAPAGRSGGPSVPMRQPRMLGAVRERQRAGARRSGGSPRLGRRS